jgi:hypothetical protein
VPTLTGIAPMLTLAAAGLVAIMIRAVATHVGSVVARCSGCCLTE